MNSPHLEPSSVVRRCCCGSIKLLQTIFQIHITTNLIPIFQKEKKNVDRVLFSVYIHKHLAAAHGQASNNRPPFRDLVRERPDHPNNPQP